MRIAFLICWLVSTGILFVLPQLVEITGRLPSGIYPLDGARSSAVRHVYLVYPKVHHAQYASIRNEASRISREIDKYAASAGEAQALRDSLVDFANPISVVVMPPLATTCSSIIDRYESHKAALKRAFAPYWQSGGQQNCTEIIVSVVDQAEEQHLDFRSVRRETGRVLFLNDRGGAMAQIILWRDDYAKVNTSQVQPLDPQLDIGSGVSTLPLDWPRIETHRNQVRSVMSLRLPYDGFVQKDLIERGQWPWSCRAQLLGINYRDSWGRKASSQWCYGDSFPKMIENDHYYAFRVEEQL